MVYCPEVTSCSVDEHKKRFENVHLLSSKVLYQRHEISQSLARPRGSCYDHVATVQHLGDRLSLDLAWAFEP